MSAMRILLTIALLLIIPTIVAAQTQTRERRSTDAPQIDRPDGDAVRNRVVNQKASNHAEKARTEATKDPDQQTTAPAWGNTSIITRPVQNARAASSSASAPVTQVQPQPKKTVQPTVLVSDANARVASNSR